MYAVPIGGVGNSVLFRAIPSRPAIASNLIAIGWSSNRSSCPHNEMTSTCSVNLAGARQPRAAGDQHRRDAGAPAGDRRKADRRRRDGGLRDAGVVSDVNGTQPVATGTHGSRQLATRRPGIHEKCEVFPVTRVKPSLIALAAMSKSASLGAKPRRRPTAHRNAACSRT